MRNSSILNRIVILSSTIMLAFTGILGAQTTKYCLYIIVICLTIELVHIKWNVLQVVCFCAILISSIFVSWWTTHSIANALVFVSSMVLFIQNMNGGFSVLSWKCLKRCTYILSLSYIILFFVSPTWTTNDQLILFFDNPNMTGIACSAPAMVLLLIAVENKGRRGNFLNWTLFGMLTYLVYLTQNRSSFISILLIIICAIFDILSAGKKRLTSPIVITLLKLSPLIVMVLYVALYAILPHDLSLLGKPFFSGREAGWALAIQSFASNPLSYKANDYGAFNIMLEVTLRYGSVAVIAFFSLLFGMKMKSIATKSPVQYLAYISFLFCLLQQCFESTLVTGSFSVYVWSYSLIGIAFMEEQPKQELAC